MAAPECAFHAPYRFGSQGTRFADEAIAVFKSPILDGKSSRPHHCRFIENLRRKSGLRTYAALSLESADTWTNFVSNQYRTRIIMHSIRQSGAPSWRPGWTWSSTESDGD